MNISQADNDNKKTLFKRYSDFMVYIFPKQV